MANDGSRSTIFGIDSAIFVMCVVGLCSIAGVATFILLTNSDNNEWENRVEDTLEDKGYYVDRIVTCDSQTAGDLAVVSGTFYNEKSVLKTYYISYVRDGGSWIVSNFYCR